MPAEQRIQLIIRRFYDGFAKRYPNAGLAGRYPRYTEHCDREVRILRLTRRAVIQGLASLPAAQWIRAQGDRARTIAPGVFRGDWESLRQYLAPDWFRDAKFGIWAHWTAQCVPEQGDWYARNMYIQGEAQNKFHVEHYGHPSKFGFLEIDHLWKAENWRSEEQ